LAHDWGVPTLAGDDQHSQVFRESVEGFCRSESRRESAGGTVQTGVRRGLATRRGLAVGLQVRTAWNLGLLSRCTTSGKLR
jgi:hypothetical protein